MSQNKKSSGTKKFNPRDEKWAEQYDQINGMTGRQIIEYVRLNTESSVVIEVPLKNKRGIIKAAIFALKHNPIASVDDGVSEKGTAFGEPMESDSLGGDESCILEGSDACKEGCDCFEQEHPKTHMEIVREEENAQRPVIDLSDFSKKELINRAWMKFGKKIGGSFGSGWFVSRTTLLDRLSDLYVNDGWHVKY